MTRYRSTRELAARLEEGTLESEIDATKMADKSTQRQKLSMIGMSEKGYDAGEEMKSADVSQSPDLEGGDDCFQENGDETLLDQAIRWNASKGKHVSG